MSQRSRETLTSGVFIERIGKLRIINFYGNTGSPDDYYKTMFIATLQAGDRPGDIVYGAINQAESTIGLYAIAKPDGNLEIHSISGATPKAVQPMFGQVAYIAVY